MREFKYTDNHPDFFIVQQWFSVLVLAFAIFPLIIKKKIQELKIAGIMLFTGVSMFIILMFILKIFDGDKMSYQKGDSEKFYGFKFGKEFLSSLSTAFVAYGFQSAFFPIYNSLQVKSRKNAMGFTIYGIGFCFIIYMAVAFISLYSFGTSIKGDVLHNVEEVKEWESYVLRAIFLIVISTHTPFIFFIGKESVLSFFALIYIRGKSKDGNDRQGMETFKYENGSVEENKDQLLHKSHDFKRNNRHFEHSKFVVSSSVDYNISMALPFYKKSIKTIVIGDSKDAIEGHDLGALDELLTAHEVLPNWMYYTITLILYAGVVTAA